MGGCAFRFISVRAVSTLAQAMPQSIAATLQIALLLIGLSSVRDGRGADFAVTKAYALQGYAQVLLVSTNEAGLGFSDQ
jgi:hypothetical protein